MRKFYKEMKLGSLFDGIAGFPLAAKKHGIIPIWASEIEPACISISTRHFPEMVHYGDISRINAAEIEPVDIITFGSPCQDLSVAGRRAGLDGKYSGLFKEAVRIIKEMRDATARPRFAVWENVPGAFSSNKGEDFRTVIEEIAKIAEPMVSIIRPQRRGKNSESVWEGAGAIMGSCWSIAWRVLNAQYWGVPQRRRRIFLVADFGGQCAGEILFKRERVSGDFTESRTAREGIAGNVESVFRKEGRGKVAAPLCAGYGRSWNGNAGAYKGDNFVIDFGSTGDRIQMNPRIAVTLQSEGGGGGAKTGLYCLQGNMIGREDGNGPQGNGVNEDISFTLNTIDRHAVAYDCRNHIVNDDVSGTLQSKNNGGFSLNYINPIVSFDVQEFGDYRQSDIASPLKSKVGKDSTDLISQSNYTVRRLTPKECERLQGFPDGWTEYGHDGKSISDSARYRALGNSVAIPCVEYVLKGISACGK